MVVLAIYISLIDYFSLKRKFLFRKAFGIILEDREVADMALDGDLARSQRAQDISEAYVTNEQDLVAELERVAALNKTERIAITKSARRLVQKVRSSAQRRSPIDALLQEYGLSTPEGVALMRLCEALIRTPDDATRCHLIRDKVGPADWANHARSGKSRLADLATEGLILSAAWIKKTGGVEAQNLLSRIGDRVLLRALTSAMELMGDHFVLGRTIESAMYRAADAERDGTLHSYDMLGEAACTAADADNYFAAYLSAARCLAAQSQRLKSSTQAPSLSVKLSALHPRYEYAKRNICVPSLVSRVKQLAQIASSANLGLTIDAEESDRLETSLLIVERLMSDPDLANWDGFGVVVQAYQRRALPVLRQLINWSKIYKRHITVRLVKGAYWDSEIKRAQELGLESYPVFTRKEHTDLSYLACARVLLDTKSGVFPQFATHNAHTAAAVAHMAGPDQRYEFQRLYGMGAELHSNLSKDYGMPTRVYAPVGNHKSLLPYLVRRLLENGANNSFVNRLSDNTAAIDEIVADPLSPIAVHGGTPHPQIPEPRNLFNGARLSACGIDLKQADIAAAKTIVIAQPLHDMEAKSIVHGEPQFGVRVPVINPADCSQTVGYAFLSDVSTVDKAVAVATQSNWGRNWSAKDRADCLLKAAVLLENNSDEFLRLCVLEAGKTLPDAVAEVREAVDFCRYYANEAVKPRMATRAPLGPVGCISPWNFPLAIFLGQIVAALSVGNTVVAKPAPQTPLIAAAAVRLLFQAGVPTDALHLLIGNGAEIGKALTRHPGIKGLCFTGSTATAKQIALNLADTNRPDTPFIAETGGINAMIIDSTALLEQAAKDTVLSAFQSAGQRCSACRLVLVQDGIADDFNAMLAGMIDELAVGDPRDLATDVGPLIDAAARHSVSAYTKDMQSRFPTIARQTQTAARGPGHFVPPVAYQIDQVSDLTREVFGPVLHVARFAARDLDATIESINALGYGLTLGLQTRSDARISQIVAKAQVGNLYVNRNQIGAVVGVQPFGGENLSGTGPKAGGPHYLLQLSQDAQCTRVASGTAKTMKTTSLAPHNDSSTFLEKARRCSTHWSQLIANDTFRIRFISTLKQSLPLSSDFVKSLEIRRHQIFPGPTGEDNTLALLPRGVLVGAAAPTHEIQRHQLALALTAGNCVVLTDHESSESVANEIHAILSALGAPLDVLQLAPLSHLKALCCAEIDGVVVDGPERDEVASIICRRPGPILPVLSSFDPPERYHLERTLTINTAAAGGNASLLTLD